jgi:hypothetical protein
MGSLRSLKTQARKASPQRFEIYFDDIIEHWRCFDWHSVNRSEVETAKARADKSRDVSKSSFYDLIGDVSSINDKVVVFTWSSRLQCWKAPVGRTIQTVREKTYGES